MSKRAPGYDKQQQKNKLLKLQKHMTTDKMSKWCQNPVVEIISKKVIIVFLVSLRSKLVI